MIPHLREQCYVGLTLPSTILALRALNFFSLSIFASEIQLRGQIGDVQADRDGYSYSLRQYHSDGQRKRDLTSRWQLRSIKLHPHEDASRNISHLAVLSGVFSLAIGDYTGVATELSNCIACH